MRSASSALLAILCTFVPAIAAKSGPLPYDLAVEVVYAQPPGAEILREELEWEVVKLIDESSCFRTVDRYSTSLDSAELLLTMSIGELVTEQDYDISLGQRDSPRSSPEVKRRMASRVLADVELHIALAAKEAPIRTKRFRKNLSYSPRVDEDPRYEVRLMLIDRLSRAARDFLCDNRKVRREIERAIAERPLED
jgi:hypothetical protein